MTALLDSNALVALAVADHVHHEVVETWMTSHDTPFATCPITQGALVRLLLRTEVTAGQAIEVLRGILDHERHECWPDEVAYDEVDLTGVVGHRQVTDAYLATLAQRRGGSLITLDRGLAELRPAVTTLLEPPQRPAGGGAEPTTN